MKIDNKDKITDIEITLKQIKAIHTAFENEFVSYQNEKQCLSAVLANFENYQYMVSVLSDLIHKAILQTADLDRETEKAI